MLSMAAKSAWTALIGRMLLAAIFIILGFAKISGFAVMSQFAAANNVPFSDLAIIVAIVVELIGGLMIAFGWKTKWAALSVFVFLIPVTYYFHTNFLDPMQMTMFLKNLSIMGGLLLLAAYGPGKYSIDEMLSKKA
jgi:putative oxidoreductase